MAILENLNFDFVEFLQVVINETFANLIYITLAEKLYGSQCTVEMCYKM